MRKARYNKPLLPLISVVIRTKNSAHTLPKVIEGLGVAQEDEIIVVDSGSTDATIQISQDAGARIIRLEHEFHYSKALNLGFRAAKGEWVLSLSSHCIPLKGFLLEDYRHAITIRRNELAAIYGSISLGTRKIEYFEPRWITPAGFNETREQPGGNGNALYRRSIWEQHAFSDELPTGEDLEWFCWAMRSGYSVLSYPAASVLYRNHGGWARMFKKGFYEIRVARGFLGGGTMKLTHLALAMASLMKGAAVGDYPLAFALRQSGHRLGVFVGAQLPPWKIN